MHPLTIPRRTAEKPRRRARGFTLVEVLVAMFIMAVLATMAWRGIDGLVRTRDGAQRAAEDALRLSAVLAQWEQDLNQIYYSSAAPALAYDGASLRLTRRMGDGVQVVVWTLQDQIWYRWASPPVTTTTQLQDGWMKSQQWAAIQPTALPVLQAVSALQVYYYRGNAWTNAQSSGDIDAPPSSFQSNEEEEPKTGGANSTPTPTPTPTPNPTPPPTSTRGPIEQLPTGVRLMLTMSRGILLRDVLVMPAGS